MQNSIKTINVLAHILNEIIEEENEASKKSSDSSSPQNEVSLDLTHCIMCFKEVIPQNCEEIKSYVNQSQQAIQWKLFACELNTIDIVRCTDVVVQSAYKEMIAIITEQNL